MRNFRYPAAIPPIQTPLVDPESGLVHEAWRRWFESLQIQAGGQGGDAIFDAELLALVQGSENAAAIEALSGIARFIETAIRAQQEEALQASEEARREIRQIADSLRAELEATLAGLGNLARNDLLSPGFAQVGLAGVEQKNSIGRESMMTPTIPNTNPVLADFVTRQIFTAISDGNNPIPQVPNAIVAVRFFYEFEATADIFDWYYWRVRISRETLAGSTIATIYDGNRLWNVSQATNGASGNASSNAYPISRAETIEVFDTLPSSGGDPAGYIYRARLDPILSPGSATTPVEGFNKATTRIFDVKQRILLASFSQPRVFN